MRRSAFIRGKTLQTRFRWRCAISAPSSAPIDLLQQRDLWQPPPSSVAPIPDLPALTPERGSSTVSGNSARRYKIQTPVTPGLFRVPVRKRARQAVTAFGDDEAGGPEHRTFDLALDQKSGIIEPCRRTIQFARRKASLPFLALSTRPHSI